MSSRSDDAADRLLSSRLMEALVLCHSQKLECHWLCQCIASSTLDRTCTGGASGTQPENQAVTKHQDVFFTSVS
jgi:hypothetical protein